MYEDEYQENGRGSGCHWGLHLLRRDARADNHHGYNDKGSVHSFVPDSETVVLRSDTSTAPARYVVTKTTTVVDETGAPVAIQNISPGVPLSVDYTPTGDRLVASRIVVHRAGAVGTAVTSGPVTTEQRDTTTTTTRPLTHEEKEALKEQKEDQKERMEKEIERKKEALEKAKDKLDDDH